MGSGGMRMVFPLYGSSYGLEELQDTNTQVHRLYMCTPSHRDSQANRRLGLYRPERHKEMWFLSEMASFHFLNKKIALHIKTNIDVGHDSDALFEAITHETLLQARQLVW